MKGYCKKCNSPLHALVFDYSMQHFGIPLCRNHQTRRTSTRRTSNKSTPAARKLYLTLRRLGVPAELEKFDGYKTIDIAVPDAKVNIEVDGLQHHSPEQALADLKRTYYSFVKGYLTLRVPNALIEWDVHETAKYIVDFLNETEPRNWKAQDYRDYDDDDDDWGDWKDTYDYDEFEEWDY